MEGYFVKNLKSILKKLTLILLASFLLAGSPKLLAMDTDSDPKDEAISSLILRASRILAGEDVSFFHEAGAQAKESRAGFEGAEDSDDSDSDTESECSDDELEKRKIKFVLEKDGNVTEIPLPETFNPNISEYISSLVDISGPEVEIKIDDKSPKNIRQVCNEQNIKKFIRYLDRVSDNCPMLQLRIHLEEETPEYFKAIAILADYFNVDFLMYACAQRCDKTLTSSENLNKFKQDPTMGRLFSDYFPGWRWIGFPEYLQCFVDGFDYKVLRDDSEADSQWRIAMGTPEDRICLFGFSDGRFKILRKYPEVKNVGQAMFVYLAKEEYEYNRIYIGKSNGLDLTKPDSEEQNTSELLAILGSFDEEARNYLIEKHKIKVEPQNIKQAMFLKLAVAKYNPASRTGLDLTLSDSEEPNTTDLLETFKSMSQETQSGLIRDWKVKVPAADIEAELVLEQVDAEPEA
jgi:hypothetical protein